MAKKSKKTSEFDNRVLPYVDSKRTYGHKLNEEELEWLTQFEREYYANDHSKEGSLHREALGDDYDKNKKYKNRWGQDVALRQVLFTKFNEMIRDVDAECKKKLKEGEARPTMTSTSKVHEEYLNGAMESKEDYSTIASLLKYYSYEQIFGIYLDQAQKNYNKTHDIKKTMEWFGYRVMTLAFIISYKKKKKKRDDLKEKKDSKKDS